MKELNFKNSFAKLSILLIILLFFSLPVHALFAEIGGALFGGIGQAVGGFVDGVGRAVVNVVSAVVSTVSNVVNDVVTGISGGAISQSQDRLPDTPPPNNFPAGNPPVGYNNISRDRGIDVTGAPKNYVSYFKRNTSFTEIREVGFSQLNLTNVYKDTLLENDEVIAGLYLNIFHEITNIGSTPGQTLWRVQMDCYKIEDVVGNFTENYETELRTDWIESGFLDPGSINSFLTIFYVPEEKYKFGGHCRLKSELAENFRKTNIVENFFCTIFTWANGDTTEDCSTTTETEELIETRGETEIEIEFDIKPRLPGLGGAISTNVSPFD